MGFIALLVVFVGWIVFSLFEGREEAHTIDFRDFSDKNYKKNLHPLWVGQRLVVGIVFCALLFIIVKVWYIVLLVGIGMIWSFPFFHEGSYYSYINKLNGSYPRKWKTNQNNSNAKFSIQSYRIRLVFMLVGLGVFILSIVLFYVSD